MKEFGSRSINLGNVKDNALFLFVYLNYFIILEMLCINGRIFLKIFLKEISS